MPRNTLARLGLVSTSLLAILLGTGAVADTLSYSLTDVGTLPGDVYSSPVGIDAAGNVYGYSYPPGYQGSMPGDPAPHRFVYNASTGQMSPIAGEFPMASIVNPSMYGIFDNRYNSLGQINGGNSLGQMVGYVGGYDSAQPAPQGFFQTTDGTRHDLGTLPSINAGGPALQGFIRDADGTWHDVGPLPGGQYSIPSGIDDLGEVVGDSFGNGVHGFLFKDGVMHKLDDLVPPSYRDLGLYVPGIDAINASGQIVALSMIDGNMHVYLLTPQDGRPLGPPVPEPTTLAVLGAGLLGLAVRRIRGAQAAP